MREECVINEYTHLFRVFHAFLFLAVKIMREVGFELKEINVVGNALKFPCFRIVQLSTLEGLITEFGMGSDVSLPLWSPTDYYNECFFF